MLHSDESIPPKAPDVKSNLTEEEIRCIFDEI